uniref:Uncharacterized protein n=1 Tax=Arundo donax TaxID=35708 RepID=A0A0A9D2U7_ARUDO
MAAVGVEEDPAVQAARILLSLRHRTLLRPPEWAPLSPCEAPEPVDVPEGWPKRRRSGRERLPGDWRAALAELKLGHPAFFAGSGSWSSGEDRERLPPRARERPRPRPAAGDAPMAAPSRRPGTPVYYVSPAGSGPSTSAADRAAPRPRHTGEEAEKAAAAQQASKSPAAAPVKEPMSASSPETPLDFSAAAAGSNASSSGDDAARPPPKRKAAGSGGASCGDDEGCSSPAKRPRAADAGGKAAEEKAISAEPKTQSERSTNGGDEGVVKFKFDLNIPWPDECPDMY